MLPLISSFWIGEKLGLLNQVCLASFVLHGHEVVLYSPNPSLKVPEGVELMHSDEIISFPEDFMRRAEPSLVSDLFRLILLQKSDTIWVDCDAYCARPFSALPENIFGILERVVSTGVLRLPSASPTLNDYLDFALRSDEAPLWLSKGRQEECARMSFDDPYERLLAFYNVRQGFLGPKALNYFTRKNRIRRQCQPQEVFYPVAPREAGKLLAPRSAEIVENPAILSVHFYGRAFPSHLFKPENFPDSSFAHFAYRSTKALIRS